MITAPSPCICPSPAGNENAETFTNDGPGKEQSAVWQGMGWQGVISALGVKYKSPWNENNLRLQMQRNAPGSAELSSARREQGN